MRLAYNQAGWPFDEQWNSSRPSISVWAEWIGGTAQLAIRESIGPDEDLISIILQVSDEARRKLNSDELHYMPEIGEGGAWLGANSYNGSAYCIGYMEAADLAYQSGSWDSPEVMPVGMSRSGQWPPHRDLWWAMQYDADKFRDLFAVDVVNVALDDVAYTHPDLPVDELVWEIYRGISLSPGETPDNTSKGEGYDLGYSWTVSLDAAMAIAERGKAGFTTDQIVGDTYVMREDDSRMAYVPWVLRAEINESDANVYFPFGGSAYSSEQEIEVPRGTPLTLTGYMSAEAVYLADWVPMPFDGSTPEKTEYEESYYFGKFEWPSYWTDVYQERTAALEGITYQEQSYADGVVIRAFYGGEEIGTIDAAEFEGDIVETPWGDEDIWVVQSVYIEPEYRGQKVAAELFDMASKHAANRGFALVHSNDRTEDADYWIRSLSETGVQYVVEEAYEDNEYRVRAA